jgi:hypothetical protein
MAITVLLFSRDPLRSSEAPKRKYMPNSGSQGFCEVRSRGSPDGVLKRIVLGTYDAANVCRMRAIHSWGKSASPASFESGAANAEHLIGKEGELSS